MSDSESADDKPPKKKYKHVNDFDFGRALQMRLEGKSIRFIAGTLSCPPSTIDRLFKRFEERGCHIKFSPPGRPSVITRTLIDRVILCTKRDRGMTIPKLLRDNPELGVSEDTIRRLIYEHTDFRCYRKKLKPYVSKINREKRVDFAKTYVDYPPEFWLRIIFSDESPFELRAHGQTHVWRTADEEYADFAYSGTLKNQKKYNYWGCFCAHRVGELYPIEDILDASYFSYIQEWHALPSAEFLFPDGNFIWQEDNDPKHTEYKRFGCRDFWERMGFQKLDWPAQSPDLNPIENLWAILDRRIQNRRPKNGEELTAILTEASNSLPVDLLRNLALSMPNRLRAVIESNGYPTKY